MKIKGSLRTEGALLINIIYSIHVLSRRKITKESQQGIYLHAEVEMAPDTIGHVLLKTTEKEQSSAIYNLLFIKARVY